MIHRVRPVVLSAFALLPIALAQEGMPAPAPELKKLEPLVGNWRGKGTLNEPGGTATEWDARGTFRWALDGHFLQEDFAIDFEGRGAPLVFRSYMGWDRENKRYVSAVVNSSGHVALHDLTLLPDGTLMQLIVQHQEGQPYVERSLLKIDGQRLVHSLDLLMSKGASMTMIDCAFERGEARFDGQFDVPAFMNNQPHEAITKLVRSAGTYDVKSEMVMAAGQSPIAISGVDTLVSGFGGMVLHGHTEGAAQGMPGKYVGEVFWGHDAAKDCLIGVYVSNMGEVMSMQGRWSGDGKLISTSCGLWMGQPSLQRMVLEFDGAGAATRAVAHTMVGTAAPHESFSTTFTQKK